VSDDNPRLSAFEARLAQLRLKMEAGLGERAARVDGHLRKLDSAPIEAREGLRQEAHKLRGVAGTFGHAALGEIAGALEQIALSGPRAAVVRLAEMLIEAVRDAGGVIPPVASTVDENSAPAVATPARRTVRRVLAIDDDPETRTLLELTLSQLGKFDTVIVLAGAEALQRLSEERFDLVLCDAMMPDMNGLTLCERARQLATTHPLPPIVILSAATPDELGWKMNIDHAPFGWWRKPFRPKQLVDEINALLDAGSARPTA